MKLNSLMTVAACLAMGVAVVYTNGALSKVVQAQEDLASDVHRLEDDLADECAHTELDEVWEAIQKVENGVTFNRYFHDRLRERVDRLQVPMAEPNLQENPLLPPVSWEPETAGR